MAGEPFEAGEEKKKEESPAVPASESTTDSPAAASKEESSDATGTAAATASTTTGEGASTEGGEEDTGAQVAPIVRLEEVVISTGEENEEVLLDLKSKLYRFDREGNQWKERGAGQVKLLQQKETKKVRLLMRQSRTLKICANHLLHPGITLQEHAGSEKSWVWHASDYSDGELKEELFCIRLGSVESAQKFKSAFEDAQEKTGKGEKSDQKADTPEKAGKVEKPDEKADETAAALEGLSVGEKPKKETESAPVEAST